MKDTCVRIIGPRKLSRPNRAEGPGLTTVLPLFILALPIRPSFSQAPELVDGHLFETFPRRFTISPYFIQYESDSSINSLSQ